MFQKNVSTLIQSLAVFTVAAIIVSSTAMVLSESIAEMNHQIDIAAIGGLFDLVAAIFLALINVIAAGSESLLSGAKIGLYTSAAISVTYSLLLIFLQERIASHLWRLALALILAEAGAIGAILGARNLDVRYLLWFTVGAALFGLLASLFLSKSQQSRFAHAPMAPSMRPASFVTLLALVIGAGAILFLILSPFIQPNRSAAAMMRDMTLAEVIMPGNASSVVELARVEAKDVTQALFFPDGNEFAVATSEGVVLYDAETLTPVRTIETGASRRIAISPDGNSLATIAGTNAQVWAVNDGTLLYTLTGHTGTVQDVAFSPDGRMVATASLDRSVRLWRVSSGDLIYTLSHIGHVYSLDFRMDGQVLATGSDMGITLWQPTSGLRLRITDVIFAIADGVAFSRDGLRLAAAMDTGDLRLREGNNYSISRNLQRQQAITTLTFSPDGQLLVFGGIDQSLHFWPLTDDVVLASLNGHQGTISSVAFSPDGRLLITAALDGTVRLWGTEDTSPEYTSTEVTSTEEIEIQGISGTVASTTPLTAGATSVSTVVNLATPTSIPKATPTTESASRVRVTMGVPESQPASPLEDPTAAPTNTSTATDEPTPSPTVTRTATPTQTPIATQMPTQIPTQIPVPPGVIVPSVVGDLAPRLEVSVDGAVDVAYSVDGRWLAVAAVDRVLILDGQTLAQLDEIETQATTLSFSPNSEFLATASGTVASLWRVADGELIEQFELHSSAIMDVAFSPDGTTLATASLDKMARLWRVSDAALLHQFDHFGSVHSLAFSPDGTLLATGTTVGAVQWQVSDGRRKRVLTLNPNRANRLAFSSDGQNLAAAIENGNIWVWRAGGAGEWLVLQGHTNTATDVAFSVDGQLLASASADGTLRLWRMSDGAALRALSSNAGAVTSVLFHPDGTTLLTATADGTLQEWGLPIPVATPTVQTSTRSAETAGVTPLDLIAIEPVEISVVASDWQLVGAGNGFAEVTHCGDGLLWYSPDFTQGEQGAWSFDGQQWEMHFAGNAAVVACDPEGAPYAVVIPDSNASGQGLADTPPVVVYRRENGQWTKIFSWDYGYELWEKAIFFDLAVDRDGGLWLPSLLGDGTQVGVISTIFHFDGSTWHIYVSPEETRLDDPRTRAGGALRRIPRLQIHKTLPRGYEFPLTSPQEVEGALALWSTDIDTAADGAMWISRPFLAPQRFDGQHWQNVVQPRLLPHIIVTLEVLGVSSLEDGLELANWGVLEGNGAPWLGVAGGVLHRKEDRWMLYHLSAADSAVEYLIPLAAGADGSIWFWHSDHLLRYDGEIWQRFSGDDNFGETIGNLVISQPGPFLDATVGPDGALWVGGLRFLPGGTPLSLPAELAQ